MVKELISKMRSNKKMFIFFVIIILLLLGDLALITIDQLFGQVKGVIFGYRLIHIIFISIIIGALSLIGLLSYAYISFNLIKFLRAIRNITIKQIKRALINIAITIVTIVVFIFLIEVVFYFILTFNRTPYARDIISGNLFLQDSVLGSVLRKNAESEYNKILIDPSKHDTSFIFKTTVRTDSFGNRLIDIPGMYNRKKYAIFFGCSVTFGVGMQDTQTLPYDFAKYDTNYCVYNFGVGGFGPQNMLVRLEHTNLKKIIKQDSGICFYIYTVSHPWRVIGDMDTYSKYGRNLPYYGYNHDSLFYYGIFSRNRKLLSTVYSVLGKSNVVKYFKMNFPHELKPKHFILTCDIIYKSYLEYRKQFHNDNFYVIIYPTLQRGITDYLKYYDIKVLDFSKLYKADDKKYYLSIYDPHPTPLAYKIVLEHLIDSIGHTGKKKSD